MIVTIKNTINFERKKDYELNLCWTLPRWINCLDFRPGRLMVKRRNQPCLLLSFAAVARDGYAYFLNALFKY